VTPAEKVQQLTDALDDAIARPMSIADALEVVNGLRQHCEVVAIGLRADLAAEVDRDDLDDEATS
jgi:hypothetical protein